MFGFWGFGILGFWDFGVYEKKMNFQKQMTMDV
jgi:hypothetical protein